MPQMSRRDFLKLSAIAPLCAHRYWNDDCVGRPAVEGYASATSVLQGQTIALHASSATPSLMRMDIIRIGLADVPMHSQFVSVGSYEVPPEAWKVGCDWPPFYNFRVPETW